jgi:hypothetical protein
MNNDRKETERRELRRNQIVGILGGVIGGVMVAFSWPGVEEAIGLTGAMMWGAAIGGVLGSLQQFGQLGKRITHSDNGALNTLVGISIPLLIVAVLALIFRLAGYG